MNSEMKSQATIVHKSYFDKAKKAKDHGYFLEAVMLEYAAIEGRLEVICGILECPCNKELKPELRKKINISHRIECLKKLYKSHPACKNSSTKIDHLFWMKMKKWLNERNKYVHGLYKRPEVYQNRLQGRKELAERGFDMARLLYNEAKRLRRISHKHPEKMIFEGLACPKSTPCFI